MFQKNHTIKLNLPGGIIPAGDLFSIITAAENAGVKNVQFGTRQQMFLKVKDEKYKDFANALKQANIFFESNADIHPNILSSYVTENVFQTANWLREGVYRDVLDLFDYLPRLKINLVDHNQTFVPFFTGHLNFVASSISNYWHLHVRFPKTNQLYEWKALVYSNNIPRLSKKIEDLIFSNKKDFYGKEFINGETLYTMLHKAEHFVEHPISEPLALPDFSLPYYEGFNFYGDKMWLGIYSRDEVFSLSFLKDICAICFKTKIAQLYTTPWKSLIIKGISPADRKLWDYVLGKCRINVRHALNELCWQTEDLSIEGLDLKNYLVRRFHKDDVRTYGLCFAVKTHAKSSVFGSVIIRKQATENANHSKSNERFSILYTKDFNPNTKEYILFRSDVEKEFLYTYLLSLCKYFYELQSEENLIPNNAYRETNQPEEKIEESEILIHQCIHCLTIYDDEYGDTINDIPAGISFASLTENYSCPTCGSSKESFIIAKRDVILS